MAELNERGSFLVHNYGVCSYLGSHEVKQHQWGESHQGEPTRYLSGGPDAGNMKGAEEFSSHCPVQSAFRLDAVAYGSLTCCSVAILLQTEGKS